MNLLQEYKCLCCGGAIEFDSTAQKMKCPYCSTEFDMETLQGYDDALVMECLENIKSAMDKQYQNLFEDDKLDLTVEMEALALACKRDGLLYADAEENFERGAPT